MKLFSPDRLAAYFGLTLLLSASFLVAGCGGGNASVEGTVTLDDKPLPYGQVTFNCKQDNKTIIAQIKDGKYRADDVPQGDAVVTVSFYPPTDPGKSMTMKNMGKDQSSKMQGGMTKEDYETMSKQYKAVGKIPDAYTNTEKKLLTLKVVGGTNNFPIKMDSKKQ